MENFEHYAIASFSSPPLIWIRYVDGTFCILNPDFLPTLFKQLNSIIPSALLLILHSKKNTSSLSFLGVTVYRNQTILSLLLFIKNPPMQVDIYNSSFTILDYKNSLLLILCIIELIHTFQTKTNKNYTL